MYLSGIDLLWRFLQFKSQLLSIETRLLKDEQSNKPAVLQGSEIVLPLRCDASDALFLDGAQILNPRR